MRTVRAVAILVAVVVALLSAAPLAQAADYVTNYQVSVQATSDTTITQYGTGTRNVTATVTSQFAQYPPDGSVKFDVYGGPSYGTLITSQTVPLGSPSGSSASAVYGFSSSLGTGSYQIKTTYIPTSTNYFGSRTSDSTYISILPRSTKVQGSANVQSPTTSQTTRPVNLTATVSPLESANAPANPASGTVTFKVNNGTTTTTIGTSTVTTGGVTNQTVTANLAPGSYTLLTQYTPGASDANYAQSSESSVAFTVAAVTTTTQATTSVGTAVNSGTSREVTLSTTVQSPGAPASSQGTVTYTLTPQGGGAATTVGPVAVTNGATAQSKVNLAPGTYTLLTSYSGGGVYANSTETKTLQVQQLPATQFTSIVLGRQNVNSLRLTANLFSGSTSLAGKPIVVDLYKNGVYQGTYSGAAGGTGFNIPGTAVSSPNYYSATVHFTGDTSYSGTSGSSNNFTG